MAEEHLHDTIEKYLLGELPIAERESLEANMAIDPTLFEQVEIQRLALMGLQRLAAAGLHEKFVQWDEDLDGPPPSPSPPPANRTPWLWTITALFLLLIAGVFWHFWQAGKVHKTQELERLKLAERDSVIVALRAEFQQKVEELSALLRKSGSGNDSLSMLEIKRLREELNRKDRMLRALEGHSANGNPKIAMQLAPLPNTATRGNENNDDPTISAAKKAYDSADFTKAVRLLKSIPQDDPRQAQVTQLLPFALFYAQFFQQAIPAFLNLWEQDEYEAMNAQGYLLLCYIAEGKILEARQLRLVILRDPKHKHYPMAIELTEILNIKQK